MTIPAVPPTGGAVVAVKINGLVPHLAPKWSALPALAADLERWGAGQLVLGEHLFTTSGMTHPGGAALQTAGSPDTLSVLAALAATTSRIRLATSVLVAALHHPITLAKQAATVDALSGGRLDLGLGAGWFQPEFEALEIPFEERFTRLEETVAICRALWRPDPASFAGPFHRFEAIACALTPSEPIALWIGGGPSVHTARRVADLAEGWAASESADPDSVARAIELIRARCAQIGRDPATVAVRATLPTPTAPAREPGEAIEELVEAATSLIEKGSTHLVVPLSAWTCTREGARAVVSELAARLGGEAPR